ncbi:hypothetical protein EIP91_011067 [Steccherinum ochraceum]|uniref:WIBG Mago-binding domain-containing protein n=1 Tax=Steccherinum ochraceum TaxID=92696 RepID=A0A4R0RTN0_9APHY|nr:hypothetical protein EIP91_011067 [Steccherinum ochraceum]
MSKPDLFPKASTAGITVDPRTLERVIPESRRPDGSVRKQIKIRPGFTPQEDVSRFRGTRQAQMDTTALPKGHIIGWAPPSANASSTSAAKSKSAKKNEKRKEKRKAEKDKVKDDWEDDDDDEPTSAGAAEGVSKKAAESKEGVDGKAKTQPTEDELADKIAKLDVK